MIPGAFWLGALPHSQAWELTTPLQGYGTSAPTHWIRERPQQGVQSKVGAQARSGVAEETPLLPDGKLIMTAL